MLIRLLLTLAVIFGASARADAQVVTADAVVYNIGSCVWQSGTGSPEGAVTANPCAYWIQTDAPYNLWRKTSGSGNTGWTLVTTGGTVTSVGMTVPTGFAISGSPITTAGTLGLTLASGYMIPGGGNAGDWLKSNGASAPSFAAPAALTKVDDTNVTLTLGGSASTSLLNAASLTLGWSGRLALSRFASAGATNTVLAGGAGDSAYTATPTVTSLAATTSVTTPVVYGSGTPKSLGLGGSGISGCSTNPPSSVNCEAGVFTFNAAILEQRYATNDTYRSQWFVNETGGRLRSFTTDAFIPLTIQGAPIRLGGGGVHFGERVGVADPGLGNASVDGWFRSTSPAYVSQTSGMALDFTTGSIDAQYIYATEMHVKNFIADLEQALAGSQIISKSVAVVSRDFTVPAGGSVATLYLRDLPSAANMAVFESGDTIRLRQFSRASGSLSVTDAYGVVTSYSDLADGEQSWTFTRSLSPCSGAMSAGAVIAADSLALDYGVSGNGFIETNAIDGVYGINSPYTQAVTWSGCASTQTVRTRVGNLRGITGSTEYGFIGGTFGADSAGRYIIFSDQRAAIHNVPLSLYSGSNLTLYMDPVLSSFSQAGSSANTMTYGTGTGCWSGMDAGTFKWRCGIPGGQGIFWNGTTLNVNGNITVTGFVAEDTNNVDGVPSGDVASGAARALIGLTADGNPSLPDVATPSGSGLFLGSDYLGYYTGGTWRTYMANNGDFFLGGTSGNLTWTGGVLTVTGVIVANTGYIGGSGGWVISSGLIGATRAKLGSDGTNGYLGLGATPPTTYGNNVGVFLGSNGASPARVSFYADTNNFFQFDGVNVTWKGANTSLDASGNLTATSANLTGTITANAGYIGGSGGWGISAGLISATYARIASNGTTGYVSFGTTPPTAYGSIGAFLGYDSTPKFSLYADANNYLLWDGAKVLVKAANFTLDASGNMTAANVDITGAVTATSGSFTGAVTATSGSFTGAVYASSGTFTGTVTASSGSITGGFSVLSTLTVGTSGLLVSGATDWSTGTGYVLDYNGGTPRMRIGEAAGQRFEWDGANANMYGANFELSATYGLRFDNAGDETDLSNMIHWNSGGRVGSNDSRTWLWGPDGDMSVTIYNGSIDFQAASGPTSIMSINESGGEVWIGDYASGTQGRLFLPDVSSTTGAWYPVVIGDGYQVQQKSNGYNGDAGCGFVGNVTADYGILTGVTCTSIEALGLATRSEVDVLRSEIAELRALVFSLTGGRK
jgi:hypothetical protein